MLAVSLELLVGRAGIISLAHAAVFGIGAYSSAIISIVWPISFLFSISLSAILGAIVSIFLAFPARRLRGDYLVMATFAFQVIAVDLMLNWTSLTRGPMGIAGILPPRVFGFEITGSPQIAILFGFVLGGVLIAQLFISRSPFGRVLYAIREDEAFAKSCGKDVGRTKATAIAFSCSIAAIAGACYAHYLSFIDPTSFGVNESIMVLSMVVIGGADSTIGPLLGAMILVLTPELLRFVGLENNSAANIKQMIYGTGMVLMMLFRPRGLAGNYNYQ